MLPSQICSWFPGPFAKAFPGADAAIAARFVVIYYQTSGSDSWFRPMTRREVQHMLVRLQVEANVTERVEKGLRSLVRTEHLEELHHQLSVSPKFLMALVSAFESRQAAVA